MKTVLRDIGYIILFMVSVVVFSWLLFGCNPVKKVLSDPKKMDQVGREWEKSHGCVTSTTIEYLPGKTDTIETVDIIEVFDTTVRVDSFEVGQAVVKYVDRVITRTIHKTDTLVKKIEDVRRLQLVTDQLRQSQGALIQLTADRNSERKRANKWMWFGIVASLLFVLIMLLLFKITKNKA